VKFSPALLLSLTSVLAGLAASPAQACDRPGTPDMVQARAVSSTAINFRWRNTTRSVLSICFDFEVRDSTWKLVRSLTGQRCREGSYHQPMGRQFSGLTPNTQYHMRIRARTGAASTGCVSKVWSAYASATTKSVGPAPGGTARPDACVPGFVWRQVNPQDHVCVTPAVRAQVRADNKLAPQRRVGPPRKLQACPRRGTCYAYNIPCKPGFVWREAVPGDYVCVTPAARAQAQADNRMANTRRMGRKQVVR